MCDNMSSIDLVKNLKLKKKQKKNKIKHIDVRYHFIRLAQEEKEIDVKHKSSNEHLADLFTNALPNPRFSNLCEAINVMAVTVL